MVSLVLFFFFEETIKDFSRIILYFENEFGELFIKINLSTRKLFVNKVGYHKLFTIKIFKKKCI